MKQIKLKLRKTKISKLNKLATVKGGNCEPTNPNSSAPDTDNDTSDTETDDLRTATVTIPDHSF